MISRFSGWQCWRICLERYSGRLCESPAGEMTGGRSVALRDDTSTPGFRMSTTLSPKVENSETETLPGDADEKENFRYLLCSIAWQTYCRPLSLLPYCTQHAPASLWSHMADRLGLAYYDPWVLQVEAIHLQLRNFG